MSPEESREEDTMEELEGIPLSARLVIEYLMFEHLINGKSYLTFDEVVKGTGLGVRTARNAINLLRKRGLIDAYMNVTERRKYLYRLNFKNLAFDKIDVVPGLYIIDIGLGTVSSMTFRMYRTLRASSVAFHTDTVPPGYLEFTKCTCAMQRLSNYKPESFAEVVNTVVNNGGVVSLIMDLLLDNDKVKPYIDAIFNGNYNIKVFRLTGVSPIQVALELLMSNCEDKAVYKRGDYTLKIITSRKPVELEEGTVKAYILTLENGSLRFEEYRPGNDANDNALRAYIMYVRTIYRYK
ncbi:hypothetical protein [Vulcanisaeta thermophila]|uniref:hypothetical protein n=1 Tax=Vulcanisaeta thermophila TaxID=867917 RepID=UPI000852E05B|nr:hypothetical protein [Vulcanisaeta thermophila]